MYKEQYLYFTKSELRKFLLMYKQNLNLSTELFFVGNLFRRDPVCWPLLFFFAYVSIYQFEDMSEIEPKKLAVTSGRANNLTTHPSHLSYPSPTDLDNLPS
jgi:hypothetical protein